MKIVRPKNGKGPWIIVFAENSDMEVSQEVSAKDAGWAAGVLSQLRAKPEAVFDLERLADSGDLHPQREILANAIIYLFRHGANFSLL